MLNKKPSCKGLQWLKWCAGVIFRPIIQELFRECGAPGCQSARCWSNKCNRHGSLGVHQAPTFLPTNVPFLMYYILGSKQRNLQSYPPKVCLVRNQWPQLFLLGQMNILGAYGPGDPHLESVWFTETCHLSVPFLSPGHEPHGRASACLTSVPTVLPHPPHPSPCLLSPGPAGSYGWRRTSSTRKGEDGDKLGTQKPNVNLWALVKVCMC